MLNPFLSKITIAELVKISFVAFIFAILNVGFLPMNSRAETNLKSEDLKSILIAARQGDAKELKSLLPKISNPSIRDAIIDETKSSVTLFSQLQEFASKKPQGLKKQKIQAQSPKRAIIKSIYMKGVTSLEKAQFQNAKTAFFKGNDNDVVLYSKNYLNSKAGGPLALYGGYSSYRIGDFDQALFLFSFAANWENFDSETKSNAAFWAARSANKLGNSFIEDYYLKLAALDGFTFYGQLALESLGQWKAFLVPSHSLQNTSTKKLLNNNEGVNASLAFCEIDEMAICEKLLTQAFENDDGTNSLGFYQLAMVLGFDKLVEEIDGGDNFASIAKAYPISEITPHGNEFVLDRALIYAIMRQESRFNATAVSYAGARGLMQIMPATAAWISKNPAFRTNPSLLNNQKTNVTLGENYLEYLLNLNVTEASLPKVLVAYNAGPGNLNSWQKRMIKGQDTLMFIETIPNEQSRDYVKKVMANLWIYHKRLGQNAPSLIKLADGKIPQYEPQDDPRTMYSGAANTIALKAK